jgi:acetylglutamate kinase
MNDSTVPTGEFDTSKPDQAKARTLAAALPWLIQNGA